MFTFSHAVLQLLDNCGCIQHKKKFAGLTVEKLNKYTLEDFVGLFGSDVCEDSTRIYEEVQRSKTENEREQNSDDDDVKILDVIVRAFQSAAAEEIIQDEEVTHTGLESPADEEVQNFSDGSQSSELELNASTQGSEEGRSDEDDSSDDKNLIVLHPEEHDEEFLSLMTDDHCHVRILGHKNSHECSMKDHPSQQILQQWNDGLIKWGSYINSLEMSTWTWKESNSSCPYNLLKILTQCPSLRKLSLKSPFCDIPPQSQSAQLPAEFKLPKLEVLRISHEGEMEHSVEYLEQIIMAAANLQKINYTFDSPVTATSFLFMLRRLKEDQLNSLKILSIKSNHLEDYLTQVQVLQLANIKAPSLEELELGHGLWEGVRGSIVQQMLYNFPTLRMFIINGTFKGSSEKLPNTLIVFPLMPNLEYIEFGADYGYTTTTTPPSSSHSAGPPSKIRKDSNGERLNSTASVVNPFSVTLQFSSILPRLKSLILGNMFEVKELHFSSFPIMEQFSVACRWDLAVIFPPLTSRHASYPLITILQIPDCLNDPSFLKLIPTRFPNLIHCDVVLPTVKVLRTFFSTMSQSNLQQLYLMTQFDFASSLDTCLLEKPTEAIQDKSELEKICLLKKYKYWKEFVQHHNIQMPVKNLSILEGEGMAGLSALKNLNYIAFDHQERVLEIPKGDLQWDSSDCKYTGDFIGFGQYPWSAKCEELRDDLVNNRLGFDDRYLGYDVKFRIPKEPDNVVDILYKTRPIKKEDVKPKKKDLQD